MFFALVCLMLKFGLIECDTILFDHVCDSSNAAMGLLDCDIYFAPGEYSRSPNAEDSRIQRLEFGRLDDVRISLETFTHLETVELKRSESDQKETCDHFSHYYDIEFDEVRTQSIETDFIENIYMEAEDPLNTIQTEDGDSIDSNDTLYLRPINARSNSAELSQYMIYDI